MSVFIELQSIRKWRALLSQVERKKPEGLRESFPSCSLQSGSYSPDQDVHYSRGALRRALFSSKTQASLK